MGKVGPFPALRRALPWAMLVAVLGGVVLLLALRTLSRPQIERLELPDGFRIASYADGVTDARSLALGTRGTVFVGTRRAGKVYALIDANGDHRADTVLTVARGLEMPNGVAFGGGALYVAVVGRILRFDGIEHRLHDPPEPAVVRDDLPRETWHGWRYMRFGPDGMLYVSVGAPCNACLRDDERYATILRMSPDGTGLEVYARGVRNSLGFDWHPETGELWFTDNGRDWMGNDTPPDELNRAATAGLHFGFPYCHGASEAEPDDGSASCAGFEPPAQPLSAHVAALGMRFYTGQRFPAEYRGQVLIAEHGSWNRLPPIGYRITRVKLEGSRAVEYAVFAEGWLRAGYGWGSPVDLLVLPDGSLLVSDDRADMIYRISFHGRE